MRIVITTTDIATWFFKTFSFQGCHIGTTSFYRPIVILSKKFYRNKIKVTKRHVFCLNYKIITTFSVAFQHIPNIIKPRQITSFRTSTACFIAIFFFFLRIGLLLYSRIFPIVSTLSIFRFYRLHLHRPFRLLHLLHIQLEVFR